MVEYNKVYNCKNQEIIPLLPDKSVQVFLEDPPFNITCNEYEYDIDLEEYWKIRLPKLKDNGCFIIFGCQPFTSKFIMSNLKMFKYDLIWYKPLGTGFLNANRMPMRNHEHILLFYNHLPKYNPQKYKGKMRYKGSKNGETTNYGKFNPTVSHNDEYFPQSVIEFTNGNKTTGKFHPNQKSVPLFEYLIKTYSDEEDLIVDGYVGSWTTAIASMNTNRHYICTESDKKFFNDGQERFNRFYKEKQMRIF